MVCVRGLLMSTSTLFQIQAADNCSATLHMIPQDIILKKSALKCLRNVVRANKSNIMLGRRAEVVDVLNIRNVKAVVIG